MKPLQAVETLITWAERGAEVPGDMAAWYEVLRLVRLHQETDQPLSTFQPWRKFQPDTDGTPHGWIQWKGTGVCLDFYCKCGAHGHLDADFAYYVKCGKCGQVYELSGHVEAHPVDTPDPPTFEPKLAEVHED